MKILTALESIENTINSTEIAKYIRKEIPDHDVYMLPVIDGSRGSLEVLNELLGGNYEYLNVIGPLKDAVPVRYALRGELSIIEIAEACGIHLIDKNKRDIMRQTSMGVGQMIMDAFNKGARNFVINIGGSGINDFGMGMLYEMGVKFLGEDKKELAPNLSQLLDIKEIDTSNVDERLFNCKFYLACNVNSPLLGEEGCAFKHAINKGAKEDQLEILENLAGRFTTLTKEATGLNYANNPQAGAGGGIAYSLMSFFNARAYRSMQLIFELFDFTKLIRQGTDVVFVGDMLEVDDDSYALRIAKYIKRIRKDIKVIFVGIITQNVRNSEDIDIHFAVNYDYETKNKKDYYGINIANTVKKIVELIG